MVISSATFSYTDPLTRANQYSPLAMAYSSYSAAHGDCLRTSAEMVAARCQNTAVPPFVAHFVASCSHTGSFWRQLYIGFLPVQSAYLECSRLWILLHVKIHPTSECLVAWVSDLSQRTLAPKSCYSSSDFSSSRWESWCAWATRDSRRPHQFPCHRSGSNATSR